MLPDLGNAGNYSELSIIAFCIARCVYSTENRDSMTRKTDNQSVHMRSDICLANAAAADVMPISSHTG